MTAVIVTKSIAGSLYRRANAPNARGPSPTLMSPTTTSFAASMMPSVLLSQLATMMRCASIAAQTLAGAARRANHARTSRGEQREATLARGKPPAPKNQFREMFQAHQYRPDVARKILCLAGC
jgi:hypothetical protein